MTDKKLRIKDIAALAGVSIGTVDRALHNRGEVAAKTRERILQIAADLNYTPDLIAKSLKKRKNYSIVALLPEHTDEIIFWKNHHSGIEKARKEISPFSFRITVITYNFFDEKDFISRCDDIMSLRPDGVLFAPVFRAGSMAFAERLTTESIPYVLIDSALDGADYLAFTGEDAFRSGRIAGHLADITTGPGKEILIVNMAQNLEDAHHLNNRNRGFLKFFSDKYNHGIVMSSITITETGYQAMKTAMDKIALEKPELKAVFISGSRTYKIARWITESGFTPPVVVGYDLTEKNLEYLQSGIITFLLGQRPAEQAYKSTMKLFNYLYFGRVPEKNEFLPVDIITRENFEAFRATYEWQ